MPKQIDALESFHSIVYTRMCDVIVMPMCKYLCTSSRAALYDRLSMAIPHVSGRSALHNWIRIWIWPHQELLWWRIRSSHLMWSVSGYTYPPNREHSRNKCGNLQIMRTQTETSLKKNQ